MKKSLWLLGLCLICGLPLLAGDTGAPSSQNSQPAAAAPGPSSQQVSPSHPVGNDTVPVAAVSASQPTAPAAAPVPDPDVGWTPAAYGNAWLPHWLRLSGEFRNRDEGRTNYGFAPGKDDAYGLTRVCLGFAAAPTSWFHAFVQARDSEVIGANPKNVTSSMKDVFDLRQAYIEVRNGANGWFSLKTGRQELSFGDERLIGASNWPNVSRSFDAVRLMLRSQEYGARLDLFAASVVKAYPTSLDRVQPGRDFYGLDVVLTKLAPRATIEPYVYLKTVPAVTGVDKVTGNERLYTIGLKWSGTVPGGFDYRARYSFQSGHSADNSIHAWSGYAALGYTIPKTRLAPRFSMEYSYASGNKAVGDRVIGTFDQLYPTNHGVRGITDLFAGENIVNLKPGFDFKPQRKMKVYFNVHNLSLASMYDGLYDTMGAALVKVPKGGALSSDIGHEADIYGTYDINRRLRLGAGFGHLYAGQFLKQATPGASASYPYGFLDYNF